MAVVTTVTPARAEPTFQAPVEGAVLQGFEAPVTAFGAGHRGVDFDVPEGAHIRAAGTGEVTFAGSIAGTTWVSVSHAGAVVTSYGPLTNLQVSRGSQVVAGQTLGQLAGGGHGHLGADQGLHWSARVDGAYIDPLTLLEASARPSLAGEGHWRASRHAVTPYVPWQGGRFGGWAVAGSDVATHRGYALPPNHHHLLLVNGLASSSDARPVDPEHLGYEQEDFTVFSYAGTASDTGNDDAVLPYGPEDTWGPIDKAAERLAHQLREQAAREPGRPVDLVGHSLGGLVILVYLLNYHDPFDPSAPQIGNVVTLASPIHGSDVASIGQSLRDAPNTAGMVWLLHEVLGIGADAVSLDAPIVDELAVGSDASWDLAVAYERALAEGLAGPLGTGTRILTVGGSRDLIVNADRARPPTTNQHPGTPPDVGLPDPATLPEGFGGPADPRELAFDEDLDERPIADHRVLPGGHSSVLETEAVREVLWEFLSGAEVVQSPGLGARRFGGSAWDTLRTGVDVLTPVS